MSSSGAAPQSPAEPFELQPQSGVDEELILSADGSPSKSTLWLGFLLAFLSAWGLFIVVGHVAFDIPRSLLVNSGEPLRASSEAIKDPFVVASAGAFKEVSSNPGLNPALGEDFIFFIWFKARKSPPDGESLALMGKFDSTSEHRPGYALSLEGAPDGVRPKIYWNDAEGHGRWYSLSSIPLRRKNWYLLAIVFSNDTFISAHATVAGAEIEPMLLGGNRVEPLVIPHSNAAMVVGAFGSSRFRGQIGPFGVLRGKKLGKHVKEIVRSMAEEPNAIPSAVSTSTIALWASPGEDMGPHRVAIANGAPQVRDVQPPVESHVREPSPRRVVKKGSNKARSEKTKGKTLKR